MGAIGSRLEPSGVESRVLAAVVGIDVSGFSDDAERSASSRDLQAPAERTEMWLRSPISQHTSVLVDKCVPVRLRAQNLDGSRIRLLPCGAIH